MNVNKDKKVAVVGAGPQPEPLRSKTLSPAASGRIHGTLHPASTGSVLVKKSSGKVVRLPATRQERRRLDRLAAKGRV